ncbi:hypothetical protein GCM10011316_33490 [Roseibium aquae]|uniref:HAD family hydrolase n=1 Tax=Roseibium aquae TaxID=1323746 RepID=A0A916TM99_9HYPH|nr:hypothetical protein [Roseibium aquae]GGB58712.1 hypothetical protein GCM10011316_33490 [Roseibium aquae]
MSEPGRASRSVLDQIERLPLSSRQLIICDVDEVVLHLIRHLEAYLHGEGLVFLRPEYRLTGNIARIDDPTPLSADHVKRHIQAFFDGHTHRQELVEGAEMALTGLAEHWDVIFLTNLPGPHNKQIRESLLASRGLPFPVVTNTGPKGGAVAALAARRQGPVVFIDDSPANHQSVRASLPSAVQIQFVADQRFREMVEPEPFIALLTGDWDETTAFIERIL